MSNLGYFLAGGGKRVEFDRHHELSLNDLRDALEAIDSSTYHSARGAMMYLVAAQKPES